METKLDGSSAIENRLQGILKSFSQCKIEFTNEKEECKRLREITLKLEAELKEARELEKSHRYHLLSSREMIGNLQETVSQLMYLKRDVKKLKEEMIVKDSAIAAIDKEKENLVMKHNEIITNLKMDQKKLIDKLETSNERKIEQVVQESDTQIAQYTCVIEELRSKLKEMDAENRDKMNIVVLEYEEKIQRGTAQVSQLQEQLSRQATRTDANIDAYRREFTNEKEECKRLREITLKLEAELKEARELEKSHRYHLLSSREMIGNLQETVSQLMYLKRDVKKLKEEMIVKDSAIAAIDKEKENLVMKHNEIITNLKMDQKKLIDKLETSNERKIEQVVQESDTQIAQYTCVIEELRSKLKEMDAENRDKMNIVVLEYEEKIQRGTAQVSQLQEQLSRQATRTDANIDAYRRRLEDLEEKLKQTQFKQYLAQSNYPSHYESQVERPYSVNRDPYPDNASVDLDPTLDYPKNRLPVNASQNKAPKPNKLQVMYYGNKTPNAKIPEKKGFNITKKRKLYNDKDFQDF